MQRPKLETWAPTIGFQTRVQNIGDSMLIINWMTGNRKIVDPRYQKETHHTRNALDEVGMEWNTPTGGLTHWAREVGSSWGFYEGRPAAIRGFFEGRANSA